MVQCNNLHILFVYVSITSPSGRIKDNKKGDMAYKISIISLRYLFILVFVVYSTTLLTFISNNILIKSKIIKRPDLSRMELRICDNYICNASGTTTIQYLATE